MSKKVDREALLGMPHKDVKARYQAMFGEPPRSPNKTWMVNQMAEEHARRKDAKKAERSASGASQQRPHLALVERPGAEVEETPSPEAADLTPVAEEEAPRPRAPERARRSTSRRRDAVESDREAQEASATAVPETVPAPEPEERPIPAPVESHPPAAVAASIDALPANVAQVRGRYRSMTIDELRTRYEETVGRPTSSVDKHYLIWKIVQAEKGRIRVGPVEPGQKREGALAAADKTLPLTLTASAVEAMDAAWRRTGFPSRMTFMRTAIREALSSRGEVAAAALFPEKGVA
jgi:hypothetical protein